MKTSIPRLVIAGLSGDSGKTIVSLSILTALRQRDLISAPFKKGPDYIDSAWLGRAAGAVCRNLDTYLTSRNDVLDNFVTYARRSDIAIIEGNRGIFDGKDVKGTHSTAELAKLLQSPVVLIINCSKMTRTAAAVILSCTSFDPDVYVAGVILNRIAGDRHRKIITESIERYCNLPVLGAIPKFGDSQPLIPGRHLGLVPPLEFSARDDLEETFLGIADKYLDIDGLISLARRAKPLAARQNDSDILAPAVVKIGYFSDPVFTFYYPENLEALQRHGAELVKISSLDDGALPEIDALYIGGGFPETYAEHLVKNKRLLRSVKTFAEEGMPIYAECGGLIYLSKSLTWNDRRYPLAGVLDVNLAMNTRPAGHGYTRIKVDQPNPVFPIGTVIKGHEFHYSSVSPAPSASEGCMKMSTGTGLGNKRDGLVYKSTLACYTHIHADGVGAWAPAMIKNARNFQACRRNLKVHDTKIHEELIIEKRKPRKGLTRRTAALVGNRLRFRHTIADKLK
jgi:cobyrinic acid a,c-diamide synthase